MTVPACGDIEKNPASIFPVSALTILQLQFILIVLVFLRLNLWTREVYIMVGKKSTLRPWISYFAQSETAEAFRLRFFSVFQIKANSGSLITSSIIISASYPYFGYGGFYSYYFLSSFLGAFFGSFLPPFLAASAYSSFLFLSSYFFF